MCSASAAVACGGQGKKVCVQQRRLLAARCSRRVPAIYAAAAFWCSSAFTLAPESGRIDNDELARIKPLMPAKILYGARCTPATFLGRLLQQPAMIFVENLITS